MSTPPGGHTAQHLEVDLLLVGAGPAGLYGAYYAGVRGLRVAVVDSLEQLGGQVTAMYPEKQIYDVAGFPAVSGRELIKGLVAQAAAYEPSYLLGQEAQQLERVPHGEEGRPDLLRITTSRGHHGWTCRCGRRSPAASAPSHRGKLPAGEEFLGRGLDYFVPRLQRSTPARTSWSSEAATVPIDWCPDARAASPPA